MVLIRFNFGLTRDFWILMLSLLLINMFGLGFSPFLPYFLREIGASISEVAFVLAFSRIAYTLLLSVGGLAGDLVGRKAPMILGPVIVGASYIVLAGARSWSDAILPLTFSLLPGAFIAPAVFAYIGDVVEPLKYGRAFGIYYSIMNISAILGYLIVGSLVDRFGYSFSILAVGVVAILGAFTRVWLRETRRAVKEIAVLVYLREAYGYLRQRVVLLLVILLSLYMGLASVLDSVIFPLWAREIVSLKEVDFSIILSLEAAIYSMLSPIGGRLAESRTLWIYLSALELLIKIPALLLLSHATSFLQLLAVLLLNSGLAIFVIPGLNSRLSAALSSAHRGAIWGMQQSFISAATICFTLIGGYAWESLGNVITVHIFLFYPVVMVLLLVVLAGLERRGG
ncbi:MAG: MFS transporter [Nitrososphaerota archaeon]